MAYGVAMYGHEEPAADGRDPCSIRGWVIGSVLLLRALDLLCPFAIELSVILLAYFIPEYHSFNVAPRKLGPSLFVYSLSGEAKMTPIWKARVTDAPAPLRGSFTACFEFIVFRILEIVFLGPTCWVRNVEKNIIPYVEWRQDPQLHYYMGVKVSGTRYYETFPTPCLDLTASQNPPVRYPVIDTFLVPI